MVKNLFLRLSNEKMQKRWTEESVAEDDDENLRPRCIQYVAPLILIICPTCVLVFRKFYYASFRTKQKHFMACWKHFCLSKTSLSIALSRMFKLCMYVLLPIRGSFWFLFSSSIKKRLEVLEVEGKSIIITQPTNALIVCNLFLNHFFKTLFTAPTCFDSISLIIIREHI